jgi:FtsZ-interacting cell division protein ZipA
MPYQKNPKAKIWLWICVSAVSIIILVLWGWAANMRISSFNWDKTPEKKLIKKSQADWDTLFNNEESRIKNERMKLQIKNILNTIITETNSSSNTASTTSSTINTNM